ncbi:MAG TPA: serine/threonine-protein phosphatase, partial [Duganella sp.]|nr:serine/threonine-protein phosphatase [Duganella sp.]
EAAGEGGDNVTALAIMWQGSSAADDVDAMTADGMPTVISTEALPQDLHSTTIQGAPVELRSDADAAFDDDEIEKAIAEIRGAIEKSSRILK